MKNSAQSLATLLLALPFAAWGGAAENESAVTAHFIAEGAPEGAEIRAVGEKAIERLASLLMREINNGLLRSSPEDTVDVAHLKKLTITDGVVTGYPRIAAVKLTSVKLRNPVNAPDAAEQLVLDYIVEQMENDQAPPSLLVQKVEHPGGAPEWRVYRPLGILPACLICHGDPEGQSLALQAKLAARYPNDKATGYTGRSWRGLIRVTVTAAAPAKKP